MNFASVVNQTESASVRFKGEEVVLRSGKGYVIVIRSMLIGFITCPVIVKPKYWFAELLHATVAYP
jgi:hypothetical protein